MAKYYDEYATHACLLRDLCKAIRPMEISDLHGDDVSGRYTEASDLLCSVYGNHIATLYVSKCKTTAEEALQRGTASR